MMELGAAVACWTEVDIEGSLMLSGSKSTNPLKPSTTTVTLFGADNPKHATPYIFRITQKKETRECWTILRPKNPLIYQETDRMKSYPFLTSLKPDSILWVSISAAL